VSERINTLLDELEHIEHSLDAASLQSIALYVRACLIIADHTVSRRHCLHKGETVYANTLKSDEGAPRQLNQSLSYHLLEVGTLARKIAEEFRRYHWPGISAASLARIADPAPSSSRFAWQNTAFDSLRAARERSGAPALVLDVAGTGAGKTRMNLKAAAAINTRPHLRVSTILNLRALTLQTGKVFQAELGLKREELACVIGSPVARQLFEATQKADENPEEAKFDTAGSDVTIPDFLREYLEPSPDDARLLGVPLLVSTTDFLIAAGEPQKQGHHALALLRAMSADVIIDEIDDYDPTAFVAILRLVYTAARHGSNVIASSATLPKPMVEELAKAFLKGSELYCREKAMKGASFVGIISNLSDPLLLERPTADETAARYEAFMLESLATQPGSPTKLAHCATVEDASMGAFCQSIKTSVMDLDVAHQWSYADLQKTVSVGLVRIANISVAIEVAQYLSEYFPDDYIACYHSNDFLIQRQRKEYMLDTLLNRKRGNVELEASEYVRELMKSSKSSHVKLIIVASPVEEIGRDHDFDWAVIEPSSTRSIVQTAGRVNRHRLVTVTSPNIHVLQFNARYCRNGGETNRSVFKRPGNEPTEPGAAWQTHDLNKLIDWSSASILDARLRLGQHEMSKLEDQAIRNTVQRPNKILVGENSKRGSDWMTGWFYRKYPLRDQDHSDLWTYLNGAFHLWTHGPTKSTWQRRTDLICEVAPVSNTWLSWSMKDLTAYAERFELPSDKAFEFSISKRPGDSEPVALTIDWGFGFWR
jgi:CRISPR-associated endonuclease/helicase Cas3